MVIGGGGVDDLDRRIKKAQSELREITRWFMDEKKVITDNLEKSGELKWLDGNKEAYRPVQEEFSRKIKALVEKYKDLPPYTKIKLEK